MYPFYDVRGGNYFNRSTTRANVRALIAVGLPYLIQRLVLVFTWVLG